MEFAPLGQVASVDRQIASEVECQTLPFVGLEHIEKDAGRFVDGYSRKPEALEATKFLFGRDHVLYGKLRPYLNKVVLPDFDGVCTTEILPIRPNAEALDRHYLHAVLLSRPFVLWASQNVAGANLPRLDPDRLLEFEVPLPPVQEQKRIGAILERADRLPRMRRYALELANTVLAAAFLDMFGDPVSNPRGWLRARVADLGNVQTGNTPPREDASNYGDFVEWIKSDNLSLDQVHPSRASEGLSRKGAALGRLVDPGSVLIICIAGSATSIGNVCLTDRRVAFNQQINAVTPGKGVLPLFLYGLFLTAKPLIQRSTTLAMKRMITKGKLEELLLFKPPEDAQRRFCDAAQRGEHLRAHQREAFRQADHLFGSLLHRAFTTSV